MSQLSIFTAYSHSAVRLTTSILTHPRKRPRSSLAQQFATGAASRRTCPMMFAPQNWLLRSASARHSAIYRNSQRRLTNNIPLASVITAPRSPRHLAGGGPAPAFRSGAHAAVGLKLGSDSLKTRVHVKPARLIEPTARQQHGLEVCCRQSVASARFCASECVCVCV